MKGPGASLEIDGFVTMGAGYAAYIGDRWTAGALFSKFFSSESRALEMGLHFGYVLNL